MGREAIEAIAEYQNDLEHSLRLYFREVPSSFSAEFFGSPPAEMRAAWDDVLVGRLTETDQRSAFVTLSRLESAFRIDYRRRCEKRMKDNLSKAFRRMYKARKARVRLKEDIFRAWREHATESRRLIDDLSVAFKFRHWFAHGRYTELPPGRYDFDSVYDLAIRILSAFPLQESD
jgi:hypothetical protein